MNRTKHLVVEISGKINEMPFVASGLGEWDGENIEGFIRFKNNPKNFPVSILKCWYYDHIHTFAIVGGRNNFFGAALNCGSSIYSSGLVSFSNNLGSAEIFSTVYRKVGNQFLNQEVNIKYSGPSGYSIQADCDRKFMPKSRSIVSMTSKEDVLMNDGDSLQVQYDWDHKMPNYIDIEPLGVRYHTIYNFYQNQTLCFKVCPEAFEVGVKDY